MESKFVSKAKTVFQNAAAKAERMLTEIKADFVSEFSSHAQDEPGELPWVGKTELEKGLEEECRRRILEVSKSSEFLYCEPDGGMQVDMESAMRILELDKDLQALRFHFVPKAMKEKEFWRRYFAAVRRVKRGLYSNETVHPVASIAREVLDMEDAAYEGLHEMFAFPQSPTKDPAEEEAYKKAVTVAAIPPSILEFDLCPNFRVGRCFETCKDLALSEITDKDTSDWSSLVSGLKKISLREKDKRTKTQIRSSGRYHSLLWSLFDAETQHQGSFKKFFSQHKLPEELHGAPPESFVSQLAEVIAGLKVEHKMAEFWLEVIKECRRRWEEGQPIPRMPKDSSPDLNYCLLFQQLQVLNCCIARRHRRCAALDSLNAPQERFPTDSGSDNPDMHFARLKDGQVVPRYCVDRRAENLIMLETGEPIFSPVTQEGPVLTEELIKETEELVLRTGSFGAGCSQLFSDMQAFKAANPGCILEDFVRWYSPLDWTEGNPVGKGDEPSLRGSLSTRMRSEGNLWQELWLSARPVPAVMQAPLFDEELAGESTLEALEKISPGDFFEQLFTTAVSAGFAIAEANPSAAKDPLQRCLKECRDYILSTCHKHMDSGTLEDLCEVYELMERAIRAPSEELAGKAESKTILADIRKLLQKKQISYEDQHQQHPPSSNHHNAVSSVVKFFESKFDRKNKQAPSPIEGEEKKLCSTESGDWTIV
ncbi:hypothetical protein SELMODRAFT_442493 [Selaginella moellendorffii]|uniref:BSD domain-containing protein n=1 Tax=Selaginella moellendorffii TaxID=88036 RepID=D8RUJ5_SELML|nr:hypothetical protein SELMODRAFT_442493 [Selaginella moellendorffii]